MNKLRKKIILSSSLAVMLSGSIIPSVAVFADSSTTLKTTQSVSNNTDEETFFISNAQFLDALKATNPEAYDKLPSEMVSSMLRADWLRQGSTRITRNKNGFQIYLNSAIVKTIKYTGIGGAAILGVIGAAGITATTAGVGSAAFVGVGAVIGYISNSVNASRGIVVTFSKKGSLISWKQQ